MFSHMMSHASGDTEGGRQSGLGERNLWLCEAVFSSRTRSRKQGRRNSLSCAQLFSTLLF